MVRLAVDVVYSTKPAAVAAKCSWKWTLVHTLKQR